MLAHRAFLEENYRAGFFLVSGRKDPRTGGVIISQVPHDNDISTLLDFDPFHAKSLVDREVIRFTVF